MHIAKYSEVGSTYAHNKAISQNSPWPSGARKEVVSATRERVHSCVKVRKSPAVLPEAPVVRQKEDLCGNLQRCVWLHYVKVHAIYIEIDGNGDVFLPVAAVERPDCPPCVFRPTASWVRGPGLRQVPQTVVKVVGPYLITAVVILFFGPTCQRTPWVSKGHVRGPWCVRSARALGNSV